MKGPIVDEVRMHRMNHARKYHGDLAAICDNLRVVQETSGHRIIRLSPKRIDLTNESRRHKKHSV
jgi:hypothetical protein